MRRAASFFSVQLFILTLSWATLAQERVNHSPRPTPILVELFTSEGCSSCPPADSFIEKLDSSQPIPNAQLIVLSEHVDYFNHDGWVDPFSSSSVTGRQYAYAHALRLKDAYTPQIIVDGDKVLQLDDSEQIQKVLDAAAVKPMIPIHLGSVSIDPQDKGQPRIQINVDPNLDTRDIGVYIAIALDHASSNIRAGENDGRSLTHVAVLKSLTKIAILKPGESFNQDVPLKIKSNKPSRKLRVVVFLQESGPGSVLGAAMTSTMQ